MYSRRRPVKARKLNRCVRRSYLRKQLTANRVPLARTEDARCCRPELNLRQQRRASGVANMVAGRCSATKPALARRAATPSAKRCRVRSITAMATGKPMKVCPVPSGELGLNRNKRAYGSNGGSRVTREPAKSARSTKTPQHTCAPAPGLMVHGAMCGA